MPKPDQSLRSARLFCLALSILVWTFIVGVAVYLDPARVGGALRNPAIAACLVAGIALLTWVSERQLKAAWVKRAQGGQTSPQPLGAGLIAILIIDALIWISYILK